MDIEHCPHCKVLYGHLSEQSDGAEYIGRFHACADRVGWANKEKDELREQLRYRDPSIQFALSSQNFAELFGRYSAR